MQIHYPFSSQFVQETVAGTLIEEDGIEFTVRDTGINQCVVELEDSSAAFFAKELDVPYTLMQV
jgi:hypothetical protein